MKIALMYNYDIENPTIYRVGNQIHVKSKNNRYILLPIKSSKEIFEIYTILKQNQLNNQYYEFVMTKSNNLTIIYAGVEYVLLKITKLPVTIEERINNKISLVQAKYLLDRSNWYFLWSKKNDYIEYQSNYIRSKYSLIDDTIDYYLGMAETALAYLNNIDKLEIQQAKTITYRRVNETEMSNPLNLIVDYKERDISEYLKYLFINQKIDPKKIKSSLLKAEFNKASYIKIYARLLYPNYYFDLYENIEIGKSAEDKLLKMTKRIDEYEIYLRDIYDIINSKISIKKIDWL